MNLRSQNNERGFTLIEVLISMVLLVIISLAIYQATTGTYRLRDILMNEGDFNNGIRLSMSIFERDISLLYSPVMALPESSKADPNANVGQPASDKESQEMRELLASDQGRTTTFWSGAIDKTGIRPSHFIGTDSKISFVSVSHIRVYKESRESEFAKISYELQRDTADNEAQTLVKTEITSAFNDDESKNDHQRIYPLLRGIKKLKYRYYRKDRKQWLSSWDSDTQDLKNIYPDIVEVSIEVKGPSRLFFEGTYYFRPEIPFYGLDPST